MSLVHTVARNSLWSGLDALVEVVLPPLASIVVARAMGPAKLGSFSYVMWLATSVALLSTTGLSSAMRKHMADCAGQHRSDVFRALLRTGLRTQVLIVLLFSMLGLVWANLALPAEEHWFASLAMLVVIPTGVMGIATSVNYAVQEFRPVVIASISAGLVSVAGMLLAVVMGWGLVGLAAATLASRTCDCVVRWKLTSRRLPEYLKAMGAAPLPPGPGPELPSGLSRVIAIFAAESTILTLLTLVVWNRSEMLFLKQYSSIEQVAYFSVAFGLSLIPGQMIGPFSRAAVVSVFAERGRDPGAGAHVARVHWRYVVLLVMPASLGLAVLSEPLVRVLYGTRYFDSAPALMLAASLSMFGPLAAPATALVTSSGGQRRLVSAGLLAAVATLTLDYLLVRAYAAKGGALANGLGQAISTMAVIFIGRRYSFAISWGFVLRVTGASLGMAALVATAVHLLPDLASIIVGPALGALIYGVFLRMGHVVDTQDVERLLKAEGLLPRRIRPPFRRLAAAMCPRNG